jgi:1,4-alpha-glucan branching enzyme
VYEQFGFSRSESGDQSLKLFVPDASVDSNQYTRGGPCHIADVTVIGDIQSLVAPAAVNWDASTALTMNRSLHPNGYLFTFQFAPTLPDGYYQYQYVVRFEDSTVRIIGDPCTKYGGDSKDRSAFVVGGTPVRSAELADRLPSSDLIIYELMIDDFTKEYRGSRTPIDAIVDKLNDLKALQVNAIEFMPWIAWPDDTSFSWGYDPAYYFSVESAYVNAPTDRLDRLSRLANLITECHRRNLHVLLDIVLQHARQGSATNGFPYYWLWQNPTDSPFVGQFVAAPTYGMLPLDYGNNCTQQFVGDVCKYWLRRFKLDGFRFDQVTGFDNPRFPQEGAPNLIADLTQYTKEQQLSNISLILEDDWGYQVIQDSNQIKPTGAWFDLFRSAPFGIFTGYAVTGQVSSPYMRVLNAARDFDSPICPTIYLENHDHGTVTCRLGSRDRWYKAQPYMIALATCSGTALVHNGQEWGQLEDLWEDDSNAPPQFKRVQSRPLRWEESDDAIGKVLRDRYTFLLGLRLQHKGLRTANFYPNDYDWSWRAFSPEGYGIDEQRQVIIYHRWGNADDGRLERFIVALNFSDATQYVDLPLSVNGQWTDLLNGNAVVTTQDYRLHNYPVPSNWGCVFWNI